MPLTEMHSRLANTALLFFLIMTIWGGWRFLRKRGIDSSYWGALVIAEMLILIQGGLGAYLWFDGLRPIRNVHVLYGIISALAIPAAYVYTKGRDGRPEILIYTITFLLAVVLILRTMVTGR